MKSEIKEYLVWRRKTRFIRHYGELMLAGAFIVATVLVLWRAQMKRYETQQEPAHKLHSMTHPQAPSIPWMNLASVPAESVVRMHS